MGLMLKTRTDGDTELDDPNHRCNVRRVHRFGKTEGDDFRKLCRQRKISQNEVECMASVGNLHTSPWFPYVDRKCS
jgi:hypothetical protein